MFDKDDEGSFLPQSSKSKGKGDVFIPCGCHKKVLQTGWFKTKEMCSLTVLKSGSLN